jgi:hypothetical protein
MADKKVERLIRSSEEERPATQPQSLATPSEPNLPGFPTRPDADAKAALLDKFKAREERLRADRGADVEAIANPSEESREQEASVEK